jgi:thioester reductase-like protein
MSQAVETLTMRVMELGIGRPGDPALQVGSEVAKTYKWLRSSVLDCASSMHAAGVSHGTRVLIDATRSEDYVIRLLAGWHLGASIVPLAAGLPHGTEAEMLAQLGPAVDLRGTDWMLGTKGRSGTSPGPATVHGHDEAYVFFTSGSSGSPKGVRIGHGGLPHLFLHQAGAFRVTPGSRTSWMLAGHFDASISDIGVPLWAGACLVIWPENVRTSSRLDFAEVQSLTHIDLPPSALPALVARGLPSTLETIIVGGEPAAPLALTAAAKLVRVVNVYGPTEATVCASVEVIAPDRDDERPSLGRPLPGVHFEVRAGELLIGGWGVGLGYLTGSQDAFLPSTPEQPRMYRTGDRVAALKDGTYRFLGRVDRQVQLRGQRLELGEIERALLRAPSVAAAAAIVHEGPAPKVMAFIEGDAAQAREAASALQDWKRPANIHAIEALPRLANDKVDYSALAQLAHRSDESGGSERTDALAAAWRVTLGREAALDSDDFFALGGDSVTALELSVEAARLGVALEPEAVFEHPRLGDLARAMTRGIAVSELRRRSDEAFAGLELASSLDKSKRGVLLTGSTGMLGLELLRSGELDDREVYALVRGRTAEHGTERLERLLGEPLSPNVRVLRGDLGLPSLGLDASTMEELGSRVGEVIHAAGAVDLVRSYRSLREVHVVGTGRVMELAARLGARLHHVSTLSILVETDLPGGTIHEGTQLMPHRRVFGGYAQTKWVGDDLAQRYPLGGSVLRLGLLTASPGPSEPLDQLSRVIRGAAEIGAWPMSRDGCGFDVTPVENAARLIVRLIDDPAGNSAGPVHLACPAHATGADLRRAMQAEGIMLTGASQWPPRMNDSIASVDSSDRAVAMAALTAHAGGGELGLPRSGDLFLATDFSFDCTSVRVRYPELLPPAPSLASLRALVRTALGSGQRKEVQL